MKVLITGGTGYIGSALRNFLNKKMTVCTVDLEEFGGSVGNYKINFNDLSTPFLLSFDAIIHLAGHSSVPSCDADPDSSFLNNCLYFPALVSKLAPWQKLIYASSASVYGDTQGRSAQEDDLLAAALKPYDQQKQLIDHFMATCQLSWYGLRFGTVCGYSPVPRNELLINAMVRSAIQEKKVRVTGGKNWRGVLGMNDLCRAVEAVLTQKQKPGYYNLASFNARIDELGRVVADEYHADLQVDSRGGNPYSFSLNTDKFKTTFDFDFQDTPVSIARAASENDLTVERSCQLKFFQGALSAMMTSR